MSLLTLKNLIYNSQYGFHKNHSADFCVFFSNDKILKGFVKSMMTGIILTDLQKTFHKIDHDILLLHLYAIGSSKLSVNWFQCYLNKRSPLINLGEKIFFQPAYVPNGVLQGSNLGHLLFLICISDMTQDIKYVLFMLMIRAWLDNRKMWMKSKSKWMKILKIFVIDSLMIS